MSDIKGILKNPRIIIYILAILAAIILIHPGYTPGQGVTTIIDGCEALIRTCRHLFRVNLNPGRGTVSTGSALRPRDRWEIKNKEDKKPIGYNE